MHDGRTGPREKRRCTSFCRKKTFATEAPSAQKKRSEEMKLTAKEVAEKIGARVEGDGALELTGVAAPERAGSKQLIYVEAAKHAERAAVSAALCVVAGDGVDLPGKTVLRSVQPKVAFAKAAAMLQEVAPIAKGVHPTVVDGFDGANRKRRRRRAVRGDRRECAYR